MGKYDKFIRSMKFEKIQNNNCCICGKYDYISEKHHIIPVSVLSSVYDIVNDVEIFNKYNRAIVLCPNHHAIYHKLISKNKEILENLNIKELTIYKELILENLTFYTETLMRFRKCEKNVKQLGSIQQIMKEKKKLEYINKMIDIYIELLEKYKLKHQ